MENEQLSSVIVGRVLAQFRRKRRLSQEVVSGLADIGRTHLSAIERGNRKPTLETFYRIALALNTPASVIFAEIERQIAVEE